MPEELLSRGSCHGFEIRAPEPLEYVRDGGGTPLVLTEATNSRVPDTGRLLQSWQPTENRPEAIRLFQHDEGYTVVMGEPHWFVIGNDGSRIAMGPPACGPHREELLWATPSAVAMARRGDLVFHAAAVEIEGRALLLAGPSHAGKTTTAAAFFCAGHRLLSDDTTCCRLSEEITVPPGPALLRLRADAAEHLSPSGVYPTFEYPERVHLGIEHEFRGDGKPIPLAGVVVLVVSDGEPDLSRIPPAEALQALWPTSFYLPDGSDFERCFRGLASIAERVPIWRLERRLDWETLPAIVDRVTRVLGSP